MAVALVGGESLLGKEMREVLDGKGLPSELRLVAGLDDHANILTAQKGELAIIAPLLSADIKSAKVVILAGTRESSRTAYDLVKDHAKGPVYIDASRGLEENPTARLRAPQVEAGPQPGRVHVIAHPASIALAIFLRRVQALAPIKRCVVVVFEPASERGQPGLDELQQQTVGLLSFQKLKKEVYDAQVSFNLLPQLGEDTPHSIEDIELTIDRHLASLLSGVKNIPMPSLRLVQAPVFHGYSFSVWIEFEKSPDPAALSLSLASDLIDVRTSDHEPAHNVGVAGQSGITVGSIALDRNEPRACWFWIVADNLKITAENAVEVAREFLA